MMGIHRANIVLALALGALVLSSCQKKTGPGGFAFPPMPVETATVTRQTVAERFETIGSLDAAESITLVAEIPGVLESLPFTEGDRVGKGALIAKLNDDQLAAERDRAAALRDQAKASYERVKQVVEAKAGSAQDLDDAAAALRVAEALIPGGSATLRDTENPRLHFISKKARSVTFVRHAAIVTT